MIACYASGHTTELTGVIANCFQRMLSSAKRLIVKSFNFKTMENDIEKKVERNVIFAFFCGFMFALAIAVVGVVLIMIF